MTIKLEELRRCKEFMKEADILICSIAREIYHMRLGHKLHSRYGFSGYTEIEYTGRYFNECDWLHDKGELIFSVGFSCKRSGDYTYVTFPVTYIETDNWKEIEQAKIDKHRAAAQNISDEAARITEKNNAEAELLEYKRLHQKYGKE